MTDEVNGEAAEVAPTLEQLAAQFEAPQTPPATPTAESVSITPPETDDPEAIKQWSAKQLETVSTQLNSVQKELNDKRTQDYVAEQDKAVNVAVSRIKETIDAPDEIIEGLLHVKYSRDANFRKIFDNRAQNPEAYNRALGVVGAEAQEKLQWQPDPQAAENSRAVKELQRSANRAPSEDDPNERYRKMPPHEFEKEWERMKRGG